MADKPATIVTGASRGIGKAIAKELASLGFNLIINHFDFNSAGQADESKAIQTQNEIAELGAECAAIRSDVSSPKDRNSLVALAKSKFGRCDMLVNNAGVAPLKRIDLLEATEESFDELIAANLKGPYFLSQQAARWMVEQKEGRIVFVTSVSSYAASVNRGEYCVSKAGLSMAVALFATRLAAENVKVFEIRPGIVRTDMIAAVEKVYEERIAGGLLPQWRMGEPGDVALAVRAIADGLLDYSTGQVLNVDGGFHLRSL